MNEVFEKTKRVVLIDPTTATQAGDQFNRCDYNPIGGTAIALREPISLEYIEAYLQRHGYHTRVIQQRDLSIEQLVEQVLSFNPIAVGFSTYTFNYPHAQIIARRLRNRDPSIVIMFGGYHASGDPSIVCDSTIDYAILGEGERTTLELLRCIETNGDRSRIRGIAYWEDGLKVTGSRPRLSFSELPWPVRHASFLTACKCTPLAYPPPFQQIAPAQISYSRGCPHCCSFCASPAVWQAKVIFRDTQDIVEELQYLKSKWGTNLVYFTDLGVNVSKRRILDLCQAFIKSRIKMSWFATACVPLGKDVAEAMAEVGCSRLGFGLESLLDSSLARIKPQQTVGQIYETLETTNNLGILNRAYLMMGYPWETKRMLEETLMRLKELPIDELKVSFVTPFPGTRINTQWSDRLSQDITRYTCDYPVVKCDNLTAKELLHERARIVRGYYQSREFRVHCLEKVRRFPHLDQSFRFFWEALESTGKIQDFSNQS